MVDNPTFNLEVQRLAPYIEAEQIHLAGELATFQNAGAGMREDGSRDGNGDCTLVINTQSPINRKLYHYISFNRPPQANNAWQRIAFRSFHDEKKNHISRKLGVKSKFVLEVDHDTVYLIGKADSGKYLPKKGIRKINPDKQREKKELSPGEIDEDAYIFEDVEFTADDLELMRDKIGFMQGKLEQHRVQL